MKKFNQVDFFSGEELVNDGGALVQYLRNRLGEDVKVCIEKEEENAFYIELLTNSAEKVRENLSKLIDEFDTNGSSDLADELENDKYFYLPNSMSLRIIAKALKEAGLSAFDAKYALAVYEGIFFFDGEFDSIQSGVSL